MFAKTKGKLRSFVTAIFLGVSLWIAMSSVAYSEPLVNTVQTASVNRAELLAQADVSTLGVPFTSEERARIVRALVGQSRTSANTDRRVLTIVSAPEDKATQSSGGRIASAIVVDYKNSNRTLRYKVNAANGQVISQETLPGLAPLTLQERQQAASIVQQTNPELAGLLAAGGVLAGGFSVHAPSGAPEQNRYGLFNLLTSDRLTRQRVVYVDFTNQTVALSYIAP